MMIRAFRETDLPAVARMEKEIFSDPWTEESFRDGGPDERILLSEDGGEITGYLAGRFIGDVAELLKLAVSKELQRAGTGSALLSAFITEAKERGCETLWLEVRESNLPAIRLYEKHGFVRNGFRRDYYRDPVESAVLYECDLRKR